MAVFAKGDDGKKAAEAGADIVGGEDLLQSILEGMMIVSRVCLCPTFRRVFSCCVAKDMIYCHKPLIK